VSMQIRGQMTEVEVTLDGRENFKTTNPVLMDGQFENSIREGGCSARLYFPKVRTELESEGWRSAWDGDKTFNDGRLSERDDYYCTRDCS